MQKGISRKNANKTIRQEALREQLAAQGHVQHVVDIVNKLADLSQPLDSIEVQRLKAATDNHWKAIDKYLPNLQSIEMKAEVEQVQKVISEEPLTEEQWSARYGGNMETTAGATESTH